MTTHYHSSKGSIEIVKMNDYHLHNAIKNLAGKTTGPDNEVLAALKAEQERRGGPPKDAR